MNKKGFTLVELLATIIIIGVLLLVAIPSVSNSIKKAEKKTFKSSAQALIRTGNNFFADSGFSFEDGVCIDIFDEDLEIDKSYQLESGEICLLNDVATLKNVTNGDYCANGNNDNLKIEEGNCKN